MKKIQYIIQIIIVSLLVISFSLPVHAQGSAVPHTSINQDAQPSSEVIALRAQNELMRQYDQRLLDTVYYALAALGSLALLIVGLGWYTNFRLYRRDIEALKTELNNSLHEDIAKLSQSLHAEIANHKEELKESTIEAVETTLAPHKTALQRVGRKVTDIQFSLRITQAMNNEGGKFYEKALHQYLLVIKDTFRHKADFRQARSLSLEGIQRILKAQIIPSAALASDIFEIINKLPEDYSADVTTIRHLVTAARNLQSSNIQ